MTDTVSQPPCPAASGASSGKGVRNKPGVWDVANIAEKASPFSSIFLSPAFAQQFSALFPLSSLLRRVFFRHERLRKEARPHGWGRRSPAVPPKEFGLPRPFSQSVTCPTSPPALVRPLSLETCDTPAHGSDSSLWVPRPFPETPDSVV